MRRGPNPDKASTRRNTKFKLFGVYVISSDRLGRDGDRMEHRGENGGSLVSTNSAGAEFRKCALQMNPRRSGERFRGKATEFDEQRHADELIRKAAENGVSVLAVTDFNHVGGVEAIRTAAKGLRA